MITVRLDVWLWAARFFKTRALAKKSCELGRIRSQNAPSKPAHNVHVGEMLQITNDSGDFTVEVLALSELRGPAVEAQKLYRETNESKLARQKAAEERRANPALFAPSPAGRPSKRDRRRIIQFRGRG